MKLPSGDLNPNPCPPYSKSTYVCRVTIVLKVCGGESKNFLIKHKLYNTNVACHLMFVFLIFNMCSLFLYVFFRGHISTILLDCNSMLDSLICWRMHATMTSVPFLKQSTIACDNFMHLVSITWTNKAMCQTIILTSQYVCHVSIINRT